VGHQRHGCHHDDQNKKQVLARAKPVQELRERHPEESARIDEAVRDSGLPEVALNWLPMTGFKSTEWVVFVDAKTGDVKAFAPVDGF